MKHILGLLLLVTLYGNAHSETISMPNPDRPLLNVQLPVRGMTMNQVIRDFGQPLNQRSPVGNPPISVWEYDKYMLYFERSWLIHAVLKPVSPR